MSKVENLKEVQIYKGIKIKQSKEDTILHIISYIVISIFALLCLFPFYIILVASFSSESSILQNGYSMTIQHFSLDAYNMCLRNPIRILCAYRNTIAATAIGSTCSVLLATITGYVLQRQDFPWRNKFSFFFFFTTLFNGGLTPWYILCIKYLHFKNNFIALVLPLCFSVWYTIISKNYFKSIPYDITESAMIDGANDFTIYSKVVFPLAKPLVATIGLFAALTYWNDWYNCMLFIEKDNLQNLQYFLQNMLNSVSALKQIATSGGTISTSQVLPQETMKMAMTVLATGPIVLAYPCVQKYFIKGLTVGAVKG
jgi:putative aldouronate transport system permease protein